MGHCLTVTLFGPSDNKLEQILRRDDMVLIQEIHAASYSRRVL